jgi:hypothetical protein
VIWKERLPRVAFLFALSVVLVAGFWYHAEFYQLGLGPLLVVGGVAVTGVILGFRLAFSRRPLPWLVRPWDVGPRHAERLRGHARSLLVFPAPAPVPAGRSVVRVRHEGVPLGEYAVRRVYRARRSEAASAGGPEPLAEEAPPLPPDAIVTLVLVERLEG